MPALSCIGHLGIGVCVCHRTPKTVMGVVLTGNPGVTMDGIPDTEITKLMLSFCGHIGILITGSPSLSVDDLKSCRIGHRFVGCWNGVLIQGNPGCLLIP